MTAPIIVERRGPLLEVTIDRPKANAIDAATSRIMGEVFAGFRDDPELARGDPHRGGREILLPRLGSQGRRRKARRPMPTMASAASAACRNLPGLNKPVIAAVNGLAFGGGFEIMISADIIIAADHATFALPEINSGTLADAATIKLPRRIPYHVAIEMLFTGRRFGVRGGQALGHRQRDRAAAQTSCRAPASSPRTSPTARRSSSPPSRKRCAKPCTCPFSEAFDLVTKRKLEDRRSALCQRRPARRRPRLRRKAQAGVEGAVNPGPVGAGFLVLALTMRRLNCAAGEHHCPNNSSSLEHRTSRSQGRSGYWHRSGAEMGWVAFSAGSVLDIWLSCLQFTGVGWSLRSGGEPLSFWQNHEPESLKPSAPRTEAAQRWCGGNSQRTPAVRSPRQHPARHPSFQRHQAVASPSRFRCGEIRRPRGCRSTGPRSHNARDDR